MTNPQASVEQLRKQFGLEAVPESVSRLTKLVAGQDADVEAIGRLVSADKELSAALLRAANPKADGPEDYAFTTVEEALMRTGIRCVLILAMRDPLVRAVIKMFDTMISAKVQALPARREKALEGPHILGTIRFAGKANGLVAFRVTPDVGRFLAGRVLDLPPENIRDVEEVSDVVSELLNMIGGNFNSNLSDAGIPCRLKPPEMSVCSQYSMLTVPNGASERLVFKNDEVQAYVDLSINPWEQ